MSITVDIEKLLSELDKVQLTPRVNFPSMGEGSLFYLVDEFAVCLVSNPWRSNTRLSEVPGLLDAELEGARENKMFCGITGLLVARALRGDTLKYYNYKEWCNNLFDAYFENRTYHDFPTEELMMYEVYFDLRKSDLKDLLSMTVLGRIEHIKKEFYFYCIEREFKLWNYTNVSDGKPNWKRLMWLPISGCNEISVEDNKKVKFLRPCVEFIPEIEFGSINKEAQKCKGFISCLVNLDYYYVLMNRRWSVREFDLQKWDELVTVLFELDIEADPTITVFSNEVSSNEFTGEFGIDTDALFECYLSILRGKVAAYLKSQPKRVSRSKLDENSLNEHIYNWEKEWLDVMVNSELRTAFPHAIWEKYVDYAHGFLDYLCEVHHVNPDKGVATVVETPSMPVVPEKKIELPSPTDPSSLSDVQKLRLAFMRAIRDTHTQVYSGSSFYIQTAQDWYVVELLAIDLGIINEKSKNKDIMLLLDEVEQDYRIKLSHKPKTSANLSLKKDVIKSLDKFPNWVKGKCDVKDYNRYMAYCKLLLEKLKLQCIELQLTPPTL